MQALPAPSREALQPGPESRAVGLLRRVHQGFTLIELLVVMAIIAIAAAAVSLSLRDGSEAALQQEGERLAALLESGRAQSRASGQAWAWRPTAEGFSMGRTAPSPGAPPAKTWPWLQPGMGVAWPAGSPNRQLLLGPEPIIAAQGVTLQWNNRAIRVATDGLRPFSVEPRL